MTFQESWKGKTIDNGRYLIESELGEGGMGHVYKGYDHRLDAYVVIKVPRPQMLRSSEFMERFQREIKSLVKLQHHTIVKIQDVSEEKGIPFAVMQFMEGGSLADRRVNDGNGKRAGAASQTLNEWLPRIAEALDFIHTKGYIHRDVKPGNILFDTYGHAYLADFGIVKVTTAAATPNSPAFTETGVIMGTPEYMAPELCDDRIPDGRVDQYALAIVVYEALAGHCPLTASTPLQTIFKHKTEPIESLVGVVPDVSPDLWCAIRKGMEKSPDDRYSTCTEFADTVLQCINPKSRTGYVASASTPETKRSTGTVRSGGTQGSASDESHNVPATVRHVKQPPKPVEINPVQKKRRSSSRKWILPIAGLLFIAAPLSYAAYYYWSESSSNKSKELFTNSIGMEFKRIAKGELTIGSPEEESGRDSNETRFKVTIPDDFFIGVTEVTMAQWEKVMDDNPHPWENVEEHEGPLKTIDDAPAVWITLAQAASFCDRLSARAEEKENKRTYRLPTEDEWELACRAGTTGAFSFGDSSDQLADHGWYTGKRGEEKNRAQPVKQLESNPFGLYDMHGNVSEWCLHGKRSPRSDGQLSAPWIHRGGSWSQAASSCRSSSREIMGEDNEIISSSESIGFRVVCEIKE